MLTSATHTSERGNVRHTQGEVANNRSFQMTCRGQTTFCKGTFECTSWPTQQVIFFTGQLPWVLSKKKPVDWSDVQPDSPSKATGHIFSAQSKLLPNQICLHLLLLSQASLFQYEEMQMSQAAAWTLTYIFLLFTYTVTLQHQSNYKMLNIWCPELFLSGSQGIYEADTALICCQGLQGFPASQRYMQSAAHLCSRNSRKDGLSYYDYLFEGSWQGRRNLPLGHSSVPEGADSGVPYVYGSAIILMAEWLLQVTERWCIISCVCQPSSSFATAERAGTEIYSWTKGSQFSLLCRLVWYSSSKSLAKQTNPQQVFSSNHWPVLTKAWFE